MKVTLKENFSKEKRNMTIRSAWKSLGLELYNICQCSQQIKPDVKIKLTQSVCEEYTRQWLELFLSRFDCCDYNLSYNEPHAIEFADVVAEMKPESYEQLIEQIKHREEIAEEEETLSK